MDHGILAPHARWRSQVVRYGRPSPESTARQFDASPRAAGTPGAWTWAALMRRVFEIEVLAQPAPHPAARPLTTTPRLRRAAGDRDADPNLRPLEATVAVRHRVHGGARTWSDARCPSGGGVSGSYAPGRFATQSHGSFVSTASGSRNPFR